jgi:hypothetical protein
MSQKSDNDVATQSKNFAQKLVSSLSNVCDLEPDVQSAFLAAMEPLVREFVESVGKSSTGSGEKIKLSKKSGNNKRATKPKEDTISKKNAYHCYVADKMGEVKAQGVAPKERMGKIGAMWKATSDEDKQPYREMAQRYNDYVVEAMKDTNWKANKDEIIKSANQEAKLNSGSSASGEDDEAATDQPTAESDEAETETVADSEAGDAEDETDQVEAPVPEPAPKPAPVPAPVSAPVPAATTTKGKRQTKKN